METFQTTSLWSRAFNLDDEDEQRAYLRGAFLQMREQVRPVANDIAISVPNYTEHGIAHCDALWETASQIIGDTYPINPAETFVLGCAFLVHDLGMGLSSYSGGLVGLAKSLSWQDFLYGWYGTRASYLQADFLADLERNATWDGIFSTEVKAAMTVFLRSQHAAQAEQVMSSSWTMSNGESFYLLADANLRRFYGSSIGRIAKSHWADVASLPQLLPASIGPAPDFPIDWTVNPVKLAGILRLADAINIDARRAHPLHTPHRNPQGESADHWRFQERLTKPQVVDGRVKFTSGEGFTQDFADAWWLAYDTVKIIDSELRKTDNLCADINIPRFKAHAAAGAESPERFAAFVEPIGWEPINAQPFIGDQNLVMRQLGGVSLYGRGAGQEVAIRELLANAMDATRALEAAQGGHKQKPIQVELIRRDDADVLVVRDFGLGMRSNELASRLCNFGTSGWRDAEMQKNFPGMLSSGYRPTGQFGVGFFSVFMVADEVSVLTRHVKGAMADTVNLTFGDGLNSRPILRSVPWEEQFYDSGTRVELVLRNRVDEQHGLLWGTVSADQSLSESFRLYLRRHALTSRVAIDTKGPDGLEFERCVLADEWSVIGAGELFDALNPRMSWQRSDYVQAREEFARRARPLYDGDGQIIARIALSNNLTPDMWITRQSAFCGGLKSSDRGSVFYEGVVEGEAASAARNEIVLNLTIESLGTWFDEQVELLAQEGDLSPSVAVIAVALGRELPEMPLALSTTGWLNQDKLKAFVSGKESVRLFQSIPRVFEIESGPQCVFQDAYFDAFYLVPPDGLAVYENYWHGRPVLPVFDEMDFPDGRSESQRALLLKQWWDNLKISTFGHTLRVIADCWALPLWAVAQAAQFEGGNYSGSDKRHELSCFGGGTGRVGAWVLNKVDVTGAAESALDDSYWGERGRG